MFLVPVIIYSTTWRLFAFLRKLLEKGLPTVVKVGAESFVVQRAVCTVPCEDHPSCLGCVHLLAMQSMPCDQSVKGCPWVHDFTCKGITFAPPDLSPRLLVDPEQDIAVDNRVMFPLLTL